MGVVYLWSSTGDATPSGEVATDMQRELKIDRALYLVDDASRTYRFLRRNPHWENLSTEENEVNKRQIDGYTRVFRTGKKKAYKRSEHP